MNALQNDDAVENYSDFQTENSSKVSSEHFDWNLESRNLSMLFLIFHCAVMMKRPQIPVDAIFGASYIIAIVNEPISVSLAKNSHDSP